MIMAVNDGGNRHRSPAASHPWQHPQRRSKAEPSTTEARCCKVTMTVTRTELLTIRSRAGSVSVSEFIRTHFPADLLRPIEGNQDA